MVATSSFILPEKKLHSYNPTHRYSFVNQLVDRDVIVDATNKTMVTFGVILGSTNIAKSKEFKLKCRLIRY